MKIVQALEDHYILLKGVTKTVKNEVNNQKCGFFGMLMGTIGASLLSNVLSGLLNKGSGLYRAWHEMYRTGQGIKKKSLISPKPHPLTNFEIEDYYKNEPRFNGVCSRDNLPKKINNEAYVINLDEYADTGTHWIPLYSKNNEVTYFDYFGVEYIPKKVKKFIGQKDIKTNIFRIQAYDSIVCGYFCILFIEFMLKNRTLKKTTG